VIWPRGVAATPPPRVGFKFTRARGSCQWARGGVQPSQPPGNSSTACHYMNLSRAHLLLQPELCQTPPPLFSVQVLSVGLGEQRPAAEHKQQLKNSCDNQSPLNYETNSHTQWLHLRPRHNNSSLATFTVMGLDILHNRIVTWGSWWSVHCTISQLCMQIL